MRGVRGIFIVSVVSKVEFSQVLIKLIVPLLLCSLSNLVPTSEEAKLERSFCWFCSHGNILDARDVYLSPWTLVTVLFSPGSDLHYLFPQALPQHLRWNFFVYQGHDGTFFKTLWMSSILTLNYDQAYGLHLSTNKTRPWLYHNFYSYCWRCILEKVPEIRQKK